MNSAQSVKAAVLAVLLVIIGGFAAAASPSITVAAYYFPNFHPGDARNMKTKPPGWSEWELVKAASPRFDGHLQPKVPIWGYADESDPRQMAVKIDAAADHGISAFIFDWYYYNDGPFLEDALDHGFLNAPNRDRLKFALMWANHDWMEIQPYKRGTPPKLLYPGIVEPQTFSEISDIAINRYFKQSNYWQVDGKPYFSFYDLTNLLASFGSVEATREALDRFRTKATAAGFRGLHLNAVIWRKPVLPGETSPVDVAKLVRDLGFDSVTSYVWVHHAELPALRTDYEDVKEQYFSYWSKAKGTYNVPYFPNITVGWDPSPRASQMDAYGNFGYPFTNVIVNNTPERFKMALERARDDLMAEKDGPRILNINSWNEWTEGSYLEPDATNGMNYLNAVRDVFGTSPVQ